MAAIYNQKIITDGLQISLEAGDVNSYPGSGTTWKNLGLKGRGGDGSLTNGPVHNADGYFSFDGTNDYCNMGGGDDFFVNNMVFTVECWFNPAGYGDGVYCLGATRGNASQRLFDLSHGLDNDYYFHMTNGSGYAVAVQTMIDDYALNTWYNITMTWDGTTNSNRVIGYVNGGVDAPNAEIRTGTSSFAGSSIFSAYGNTSKTFFVGAQSNNSYSFNGKIGAFRYYNIEFTPEEVQSNFEAQRHRYGI